MRTRALRLATIAVTAILAAAACGGPDAAEVAVDEFCEELRYLIREQRLERIDDRQFVAAYGDLLESIVVSGERFGRLLDPAVETSCPTASSDAARIQAQIELVVENRLAQLRQEKADIQQHSIQPARSSTSSRTVSTHPPPTASTPALSRSERDSAVVSRHTP